MFSSNYLEKKLSLASQISCSGYWMANNIFDQVHFEVIQNEFNKQIKKFKPAQIGKGGLKNKNTLIRNDQNYWLKNSNTHLKPIWTLLDQISAEIKESLYLPIKRYEAQFAHYPPGHFYKRHVDKHKLSPARLLTLVYYISPWKSDNGGELMIYSDINLTVKPQRNSLILFLSELEHEVLPTNSHRKSLTAWFRDDIN